MMIIVLMRMVFLILKDNENDDGDEQTESVTGDFDECNQSSKTEMKVGVM